MLKRYLLIAPILFFAGTCFAQDTVEIKRKISSDVTEVYQAIKNKESIRVGTFKALYKGKTPVAIGSYENDKKIGLWRFMDTKGTIIQTYDYTNNRFLYEAPEDTTSKLRYFVDADLVEGDKVTKPLKAGGRYYGYLPYLTLFTLPTRYQDIDRDRVVAQVELLVSPLGRLADYKVTLKLYGIGEPIAVINMNRNLPDPADVVFKPATKNGEPMACRIIINCTVNSRFYLDYL
ncbi:hypothetical protein [Mucilaginibacter phyllosphaerae]